MGNFKRVKSQIIKMKFTAFILSFQMIFAISQRSEADIASYNPSNFLADYMYGIDDFMERKRRNPMETFDRLPINAVTETGHVIQTPKWSNYSRSPSAGYSKMAP